MKIKIRSLSGELPRYETEGAAGMDVKAWPDAPVELLPGDIALIPTGLFMEFESGYEVQLRARSGLAAKHGVTLVNGVGTIDSDYRGEVKVALINLGKEPFTVRRGDRIGQMVVAACERAEIEQVEVLTGTERGSGGFGHTGINDDNQTEH